MSRILLLEDDLSLGLSLREGLRDRGFEITWSKDCAQARSEIESSHFDLAVLDVGLPDGSGFDFAAELKERAPTPVIFMTALNSAENRLKGYDLGAEEFIPKPFHFRELMIRIQHVLEKHPARPASVAGIELGFGRLDLAKMCVEHQSGQTSFLALRDFRVLKLLIDHSPSPVSRDEMLNHVWGEDQFPSQRTVDNCIVRLRQLLKDESGDLIRSVRGLGYQWTGPASGARK